jgi:hypothetical protein
MDAFTPGLAAMVPLMLLNLAWYLTVLVLLFRIWRKVRHLPG